MKNLSEVDKYLIRELNTWKRVDIGDANRNYAIAEIIRLRAICNERGLQEFIV